ncbi:MT-A70 family protein [Xanthobacter versatilis]|uniref:MT-A70 family protein n=1 Tax=Xanthobacter autotrophicus (strain ATCC BAA-1158 / Py2) TaxID=78245 RepID=A7ILF3_XANP2|nr:MT-A70 family protein [Xanthobacter autotrophicus Py2]
MNGLWQFGDLKMFGYDLIVADPPWDFELYSEAGEGKSAKAHYGTMKLDEIAALRVGDLARGDCLLLLWCCEWMPPAARQRVLDAWGFTYKTTIIWRKVTRAGKVRMGPGYRARTMHEPVIVATVGNPKHTPFSSVFDGVAREHSRKPEAFYRMVEAAAPKAARADLFSRQRRDGWDAFGNEVEKFDQPPAEAAE